MPCGRIQWGQICEYGAPPSSRRFTPHDSGTPFGITLFSVLWQKPRVPARYDELKMVWSSTELQGTGAAHVEFALYKVDPQFVASMERHECVRKHVGSLALALVGNGEAGCTFRRRVSGGTNRQETSLSGCRIVAPVEYSAVLLWVERGLSFKETSNGLSNGRRSRR